MLIVQTIGIIGMIAAPSMPQDRWRQDHVKGSGKVVTVNRNIDNFSELEIGGALKVNVQVGPRASMKITADDNLVSIVRFEVRGGVLNLSTDRSHSSQRGIEVTLTAPTLRSLDVSGANRVDVSGVDSTNLKINVSGACSLSIKGSARALDMDVSGACRADLLGLRTETATIDASGASTARVDVRRRLRATASGVSKIEYRGNPEITRDTNRTSSVKPLG